MRKDTRSTRFQRSPFIRRATSADGTMMTRLRHANRFGSPSRQRKTFSESVPTTTTGMSPIRIVWPTASPVGKNAARASAPSRATGRPSENSSARERAPVLDAVAVQREVVPVDAAHGAVLVGVRRADAGAGALLLRRALDRLRVQAPGLLAVLVPQAEVRRLERGGRAVLHGRRLLDDEPVHAAELHPALVGALALAVGDREAAQDRRDPEHDADRLQARAPEVLPDLDPGLEEPLAEGAR